MVGLVSLVIFSSLARSNSLSSLSLSSSPSSPSSSSSSFSHLFLLPLSLTLSHSLFHLYFYFHRPLFSSLRRLPSNQLSIFAILRSSLSLSFDHSTLTTHRPDLPFLDDCPLSSQRISISSPDTTSNRPRAFLNLYSALEKSLLCWFSRIRLSRLLSKFLPGYSLASTQQVLARRFFAIRW